MKSSIPPFVVLSHNDQAFSPYLGPLALSYQATGPPTRMSSSATSEGTPAAMLLPGALREDYGLR